MPKKKQTGPPRASAPRRPATAVGAGALVTTRIDPPHEIAAAEPDVSAPVEMPPDADSGAPPRTPSIAAIPPPAAVQPESVQPPDFVVPLALTFEQVQNQAAQLAAQLSRQQSSLDHREAEVNARAAAVESQVRTARLWLVEKLDELALRAAELNAAAPASASPSSSGRARRSTEPVAQDRLPDDDASTSQNHTTEDEATGLFGTPRSWNQHHWQEEFERWRSAREAAPDGLASPLADDTAGNDRLPEPSSGQAGTMGETERRLSATQRQLAARAAELELRRRKFEEEREALEAERDALESERNAFVAERQAERHRLADQRRVMSEKLMRQRARLRRRRDDFDAREMALRQLRADLLHMQHQTLEMRLGAEEQWARLRGKRPAADVGPPRSDRRNNSGDAA